MKLKGDKPVSIYIHHYLQLLLLLPSFLFAIGNLNRQLHRLLNKASPRNSVAAIHWPFCCLFVLSRLWPLFHLSYISMVLLSKVRWELGSRGNDNQVGASTFSSMLTTNALVGWVGHEEKVRTSIFQKAHTEIIFDEKEGMGSLCNDLMTLLTRLQDPRQGHEYFNDSGV